MKCSKNLIILCITLNVMSMLYLCHYFLIKCEFVKIIDTLCNHNTSDMTFKYKQFNFLFCFILVVLSSMQSIMTKYEIMRYKNSIRDGSIAFFLFPVCFLLMTGTRPLTIHTFGIMSMRLALFLTICNIYIVTVWLMLICFSILQVIYS